MTAWYEYPDFNNYREQYSFAAYPVNGDDIAMPYGTPITALFSGTVSKAFYDQSGGTLIIKADNPPAQLEGGYYYYAHLDEFSQNIKSGAKVSAGDIVGISGGQNTGGFHPAAPQYSSGPHIMIGESKSSNIPYTLSTLTPDLNPHWMLNYAKQIKIDPGNSNSFIGNTLLLSTTNGCTCDPGYKLEKGGLGQSICKNQKFPYDARPCKENATGDPLSAISNFLTSIQKLTEWLSDPMRIIKLIFGILCIAGAIFLMVNPQARVAQRITKGARKVGIR